MVFVTSTNEWNCWRYLDRIVVVNGTSEVLFEPTVFRIWLKTIELYEKEFLFNYPVGWPDIAGCTEAEKKYILC